MSRVTGVSVSQVMIDYKVMKLKVQFKGRDTKELMMSK